MSLIYVTGPTGAGKTTICRELVRRGFTAYDTDEDAIAEHYDRFTGDVIAYPADADLRTPEWYARHVFNLSKAKVEHLASEAHDKPVFLCGAAYNDLELAPHFFSTVICLCISGDVAESRILSRDTNTFGKSPDELHEIKERHQAILDKYRRFGACMIDASEPIDVVFDTILRSSGTVE